MILKAFLLSILGVGGMISWGENSLVGDFFFRFNIANDAPKYLRTFWIR